MCGRRLNFWVSGIVFAEFYGKVGVIYLGHFSISIERITFYTEILTRKVELWNFSLVSLVKNTAKQLLHI